MIILNEINFTLLILIDHIKKNNSIKYIKCVKIWIKKPTNILEFLENVYLIFFKSIFFLIY